MGRFDLNLSGEKSSNKTNVIRVDLDPRTCSPEHRGRETASNCTAQPRRGPSRDGNRIKRDASRVRPAGSAYFRRPQAIPEHPRHEGRKTERNGGSSQLADGLHPWLSRKPRRMGTPDGSRAQPVTHRAHLRKSLAQREFDLLRGSLRTLQSNLWTVRANLSAVQARGRSVQSQRSVAQSSLANVATGRECRAIASPEPSIGSKDGTSGPTARADKP